MKKIAADRNYRMLKGAQMADHTSWNHSQSAVQLNTRFDKLSEFLLQNHADLSGKLTALQSELTQIKALLTGGPYHEGE
jgi:hypothetical protein